MNRKQAKNRANRRSAVAGARATGESDRALKDFEPGSVRGRAKFGAYRDLSPREGFSPTRQRCKAS